MGKAKTNKLYRTFVKGLITEASYLTYPEDSSVGESNTLLSRKGNRSRRLGIEYEEGREIVNINGTNDKMVKEFLWSSVNNDPNVTFLVVQSGTNIYFFRMNNEPLSTQAQPFSLDLLVHKIPTAGVDEFAAQYADMSSGSGFLFIAHKYMDPMSIEYLPEQNALSVVPVVVQVRDFEGVYDGLANDEEPGQLSAQHHYNLLNQGWVAPGTHPVDISTPSYPGATPGESAGSSSGGSIYYDPYTGDATPYEKTPGGVDLR